VLRPFIKSRRKRRKKIILFRWFSVSTIFGGPVFLLFISRCGPFIGNLLYKSSSEPERERGEKVSFSFYCSFFAMQQQQQQPATTAHRRHTSQTVVGAHLRFLMDPGRFFERIYLVAVPSLFFSFFLFSSSADEPVVKSTRTPRERERRERE
jgi:hypothetical protein